MSETNENSWTSPRDLGIEAKTFFKPEAGKTYRIKLMNPGPPTVARTQYVQGLGRVHTFCKYGAPDGGRERMIEPGIDFELLGKEPVLYFLAPILVYETDKKGQVGNKKPEDIEYEFQLWGFYGPTLDRLYTMVLEWGETEFDKKDLLITGKQAGPWVNIDINVAAKTALCLDPAIAERVKNDFAGYPHRDTEKLIARTVTEEELIEAVNKIADQPTGSVKGALK